MSTLVGIILGAAGSIFINTGNNLQSLGMAQLEIKENEAAAEEEEARAKKGENSDDDPEEIGEIDSCESPTWIIGTVIFISGSLLNFTAFAFAPQSILASLEGIQFVTNVLFGRFVLGSHITNSMYAGTAIIILGVVITVLAASVVGTLEATVPDLLALWLNPLWLAYIVFCACFGLALQLVHVTYRNAAHAHAMAHQAATRHDGESSDDSEKGSRDKSRDSENERSLASPPSKLPYSDYVLPITYATFSALFGTFSVVLAKILSELVTLLLSKGQNIFVGEHAWFTYAVLFGWLGFVGVWLFRMNEALSLYDPLFIIPLLQVNFILFAILSGGIYFKEFAYFEPVNTAGFLTGVSLLVFGIFLLSPKLGDHDDEHHHAYHDASATPAHTAANSAQSAALVLSGEDEELSAAPAESNDGGKAHALPVGEERRGVSFSSSSAAGSPSSVSDMSGRLSGESSSSPTSPTNKKSMRMSVTRRSISNPHMNLLRDPQGSSSSAARRESNAANNQGSSARRPTMMNFKFGAVAGLNDRQHDKNVHRAILEDERVDDSWKVEKIATRRRISLAPSQHSAAMSNGGGGGGGGAAALSEQAAARSVVRNHRASVLAKANTASFTKDGQTAAAGGAASSASTVKFASSPATVAEGNEEEEEDGEEGRQVSNTTTTTPRPTPTKKIKTKKGGEAGMLFGGKPSSSSPSNTPAAESLELAGARSRLGSSI